MGKVIPMLGGGGGADLDGLTAVPYNVLADKVFYGAGSDEPQRGLIPSAYNQTYSNISWWDNNSGYFVRMEPGNYTVTDGNGEKPYVLVPVSKFRTDLGISADKIRAGYNIAGVAGDAWVVWTGDTNQDDSRVLTGTSYWAFGQKRWGTMPAQNADIAGTDRAWCTNTTAWEQTVCLGVRNGHYLNGVNWIQASIPNFTAANIKKGVQIMNLTGTFEGWVNAETILYFGGTFYPLLENRMSRIDYPDYSLDYNFDSIYFSSYIRTTDKINLTGYRFVQVSFRSASNKYTKYISVGENGTTLPGRDSNRATLSATIAVGTVRLNVSELSGYFYIKMGSNYADKNDYSVIQDIRLIR